MLNIELRAQRRRQRQRRRLYKIETRFKNKSILFSLIFIYRLSLWWHQSQAYPISRRCAPVYILTLNGRSLFICIDVCWKCVRVYCYWSIKITDSKVTLTNNVMCLQFHIVKIDKKELMHSWWLDHSRIESICVLRLTFRIRENLWPHKVLQWIYIWQ